MIDYSNINQSKHLIILDRSLRAAKLYDKSLLKA